MRNKVIFALLIVLFTLVVIGAAEIDSLRKERDINRDNVESLMDDIHYYKTKDSLNVAEVSELKLTLEQYEHYRSRDMETIEFLTKKNRDLQAVTTAQTQTIEELKATVADSVIVYLPGDTIHAKCIDIKDPYFDLKGCVYDNIFEGTMETRDSLLITETIRYKKFLGFLWKTNKIKDKKYNIISRNPHTEIKSFEVVSIID